MTVENISWSISMKECSDLGGGWTRDLLVSCRMAQPTEPPRLAGNKVLEILEQLPYVDSKHTSYLPSYFSYFPWRIYTLIKKDITLWFPIKIIFNRKNFLFLYIIINLLVLLRMNISLLTNICANATEVKHFSFLKSTFFFCFCNVWFIYGSFRICKCHDLNFTHRYHHK